MWFEASHRKSRRSPHDVFVRTQGQPVGLQVTPLFSTNCDWRWVCHSSLCNTGGEDGTLDSTYSSDGSDSPRRGLGNSTQLDFPSHGVPLDAACGRKFLESSCSKLSPLRSF